MPASEEFSFCIERKVQKNISKTNSERRNFSYIHLHLIQGCIGQF